MNAQNRTADGRIATKKESQRSDCIEMITRYKAEARAALKDGNRALAQSRVNACVTLRDAFFADYAEMPA